MRSVTIAAACIVGTVVLAASAQQLVSRPDYWPPTIGQPVVKEWYSDIPWHQKLGTYAGNEIDEAIVMPYGALGDDEKALCTSRGYSQERCMIEVGINNVLGMLRTDTPYDPQSQAIRDASECKDSSLPCIEVMLQLSSFRDLATNGAVSLAPRTFGKEPPNADLLYGGYVITDGSTYAPQMPWYMAHYCDSQFTGSPPKDVQDPVCYGDYLSPMNSGFNAFGKGALDWPRSVPWSIYPATATGPNNHCMEDLTTCTMVLAAFNLREVQQDVGNPGFQYQKYNQFLFTWFNDALKNFATDFSLAQRQHHFPWNGAPVSWETFVYPQAVQNPFQGEFDYLQTSPAFEDGCDVTLNGPTLQPPRTCNNTPVLRASPLVYPRQCTLADLAAGNAARLRACGLNYELHHNGFRDQWQSSYWEDWMIGNQYGRTSFLFAGVPGMQMPVSFYKDPDSASGLSLYEQVHNASLFSLYLPIANEADTRRAFPGRNYTDIEFYHTLLMSNHMESDPAQFAEGIRGKVLWHNEYRTQKMYESFARGSSSFPARTFAAAFDADTAPAPFHNNTCDGCHVRNGSGVPINTANMLDATMTNAFMKAAPYDPYPVKDYTFTGKIRPMKLVFFDLKRDTTRLDSSRYSEPLAFAPLMIAHAPRSVQPGDLYYNNKVMNFYGDSFQVTAPGYDYAWSYAAANANRLVVKGPRFNAELGKSYTPLQVVVGGFQANPSCSLVEPPPTTKPWPAMCADIDGDAIKGSIDSGEVGFMLLNGKRLGNASAIEAMPNRAIIGFRDRQQGLLGDKIAGEIIWNAGSRDGVMSAGSKVFRDCRTRSLTDCFIGRFGWLGDRASLEDQVANAAFVEMNITTREGYEKLYPADKVTFPIRYAFPDCGPANRACVQSEGNGDLSEQDVTRMADYARWVGNPTRSEFTVALPEVVAGEKVFRRLQCNACHVIDRIDIDPEDTMLSKSFRDRMATHISGSARPFLSYLGTDLLMHDMGYLSQVGDPSQPFRDADGVVLPGFENYVQKIRTPALKGMRFNRFVTDAHKNTRTDQDPACDFLMHDGRACDAIEAAFIHDGPAIRKLRVIEGLDALGKDELAQLRAFLYSL
jgi:CxxC motif-containing protein (DUF1111 family)